MSVKFESERLVLRTLMEEDAEAAMSFWGDEEVMQYCYKASDREMILRSINAYINLQNVKGFSTFAVTLKENNEVIGICGFNPTESDDEIELLYHFAKKHWGKGYASEAARACLDYARNNLKIKRITASVDPRNEASRVILEKLGFEYTHTEFCELTKQEEPYFELKIS